MRSIIVAIPSDIAKPLIGPIANINNNVAADKETKSAISIGLQESFPAFSAE